MAEAARRYGKSDEARSRNAPIYSSKIIKAGALLADTKTLLAHWNISVPPQMNLDRLRRENVLGKASRSRVEDVLAMFRQSFLGDESVTKALVILTQERVPAARSTASCNFTRRRLTDSYTTP